MAETMVDVDEIDRKILAVLSKDARISNLDLAAKIGLSPTPCSRRVKRLEEKGVIRGYAAQIDASKLGTGISVLVNVRLSKQAPPDIDAFMSAVNRLPEIKECLLVTGNLDYVLKVETKDVEALKSFVLDELKAIQCVSETTTMLILEQAKGR